MTPRTDPRRTGETPNISIRLHPADYHTARVAAVMARQTIGQWLGEAIREKVERERGIREEEGKDHANQ